MAHSADEKTAADPLLLVNDYNSSRSSGCYQISSKTILWNGPLGVFEQESYTQGTKAITEKLVEVTEAGQTTIVGGGDTVAAVRSIGFYRDVSHVSTGGGAFLELLSGETLPAFSALR